MSEPMQQILACMPVNHDPETGAACEAASGRTMQPYQGSVRGDCAFCLQGVWIGPLQAKAMREAKASVTSLVICLNCLALRQAMHGRPFVQMRALSNKKWGE